VTATRHRVTRASAAKHSAAKHSAAKHSAARNSAATGPALRQAAMGLAIAVGAALLFLGYLRVSWTVAVTSDGAAQALQARDMLAGNWLLHGWTLSDVSFYPTELPEYVLVELVRPLGIGVIHVAAAATYTLLVLAAFLLARGHARGRDGLVRGSVAAVIMLAPQLGYGAFVLLLSPDHVGTQVPLLLGWLLLDRAPRRWWVPAILCVLLAWVQFADRVAVLTAVLPLVAVGAARVIRSVLGRRLARRASADRHPPGRTWPTWPTWQVRQTWPTCWYEGALAGAGLGSVGLAWAAARVLTAAGGFAAHPFPLTLAPLRLLWTHTWLTGWGVLELYGANFLGVTGLAGLTFAAVHLIGLALAIAGCAVTLTRLIRPHGSVLSSARRGHPTTFHLCRTRKRGKTGDEMVISDEKSRWAVISDEKSADSVVDSVLAVAIVANLLSYLLSIEPGTVLGTGYDAREIAAVLPCGAVLAGRVFGPRISAILLSATTARASSRAVRERRWRVGFRAGGGRRRGWVRGAGGAEKRDRWGSSALVLLGFSLVLGAYGVALGYSAARPAVGGRDSVLAGWLVAHGLRYGLAGVAANVATVESGGRVVLAPITVRVGRTGQGGRVERVGVLRYQSTADAYDPRLHDANFLVTGAPADGDGYAAESVPSAAVRATFGRPARVYRFDGYTVGIWNVNLLTKLRE
jgi:hypothetical protein